MRRRTWASSWPPALGIREASRASVLIVHHAGKDQARGARGHSSRLRAATDVELEITEGCLKVAKNRDGQEGQTYGFALEKSNSARTPRVAGHDLRGHREPTRQPDPARQRPLGPNEQLVLDALTKAIAEQADPPPVTG